MANEVEDMRGAAERLTQSSETRRIDTDQLDPAPQPGQTLLELLPLPLAVEGLVSSRSSNRDDDPDRKVAPGSRHRPRDLQTSNDGNPPIENQKVPIRIAEE